MVGGGLASVQAVPAGRFLDPCFRLEGLLSSQGGRVGGGGFDRPGTEPTDCPPLTPAPPAHFPMPGSPPSPTQPIHPGELTLFAWARHPAPPFPPSPTPPGPAFRKKAGSPGRLGGDAGSCQPTDSVRFLSCVRTGEGGWAGGSSSVVATSGVVGGTSFGVPPVRLSPDATPWGEPGNPRLISHGGPSATPAEGHSQTLPSIHLACPSVLSADAGVCSPGGC